MRIAFALCVVGLAAAQTATVPQLYVSIALPGDTARHIATVILDPPFSLYKDPAGAFHLGVTLPPASRCTTDADQNVSCIDQLNPDPNLMGVSNETPARDPDTALTWLLAHPPARSTLACSRNGNPQTVPIDYVVTGRTITSPFWADGDKVLCSYSYVVAPPPK